MSEAKLWEGRPSRWLNLNHWILSVCTLGMWLPIALWKHLVLRSTEYSLSDQRLFIKRGLLSRVEEEVELYRVKDTRVDQPLFLRMFGLGNITVVTTDATQGTLVLQGIVNAREVREQLRTVSEERRDRKGVRELQVA